MSFSKEWDQIYKKNTQMSIWPFSDLISYVKRYLPFVGSSNSVLELGCGAGANIPFFKSLEVDYFAIEGSQTIVDQLWNEFPELKGKIKVGDFTNNIPWKKSFDIIVDRSSITHNNTKAIKNSIKLMDKHLKKGGYFIGIDWFSTKQSDYKKGKVAEDKYTKYNYTEGQFVNVGRVHFSDKNHLINLFSGFKIIIMEEKIIRRDIPSDSHIFASWNFIVKK